MTDVNRPKPVTARQRVALSPRSLVSEALLSQAHPLPWSVQARAEGLLLVDWLLQHRSHVEERLLAHSAIRFRNFDVGGRDGFRACADAISGAALEYQFRASPRSDLGNNLYTSTDYPADQPIFPHNEHAYSPIVPLRLYFYCEQPAQQGGATPIGSVREITRRIDPAVIEKFQRRGILYVRNYGAGFGLPWQTVFQTEDAAGVADYCRERGIQWQWQGEQHLRTWQRGGAMVEHPRTREQLWFNHCVFFHVTTLDLSIRDGVLAAFDEQDLPQNTYYGDGERIETEVLDHLRRAYTDSMLSFEWQRGDVLLLDNVLAVHGRQSYCGPRRVVVAMGDAVRCADLAVKEVS